MRPASLLSIFGWPIMVALLSVAGLVLALFVEGVWDGAAAALIALPLLGAAGASYASTRRASRSPAVKGAPSPPAAKSR